MNIDVTRESLKEQPTAQALTEKRPREGTFCFATTILVPADGSKGKSNCHTSLMAEFTPSDSGKNQAPKGIL